MHHRLIASLAIVCIALGVGGCRSRANRNYEEVMMPRQTGSLLQRRLLLRTERMKKPKKKQKPATSKPEAEPSATPAPEEESTPPPDRFR